MDFPKIPKGIDRIRFSRPLQFNIGDGKIGVFQDGKPHHFQAMSGSIIPSIPLWGGIDAGMKMTSSRPKGFPNLLRAPEMPQMDGIKGPSKKTYPFFSGLFADLYASLTADPLSKTDLSALATVSIKSSSPSPVLPETG